MALLYIISLIAIVIQVLGLTIAVGKSYILAEYFRFPFLPIFLLFLPVQPLACIM